MITKQAYRKKYIQFKWWQYGRWFAIIILITLCLGFAAGFLAGQRWSEVNRAALVRENAAW